jgi:hypothetical protein
MRFPFQPISGKLLSEIWRPDRENLHIILISQITVIPLSFKKLTFVQGQTMGDNTILGATSKGHGEITQLFK